MQWVVLLRKMQSYNCNGVCKQILITRLSALFNLYAHTVAVIRPHLTKKNPLLKYQIQALIFEYLMYKQTGIDLLH